VCNLKHRIEAAWFGGMCVIRVMESNPNSAYWLAIPAFHYARLALESEKEAADALIEKLDSIITETILGDDPTKH